jgi:hypothetical protein
MARKMPCKLGVRGGRLMKDNVLKGRLDRSDELRRIKRAASAGFGEL